MGHGPGVVQFFALVQQPGKPAQVVELVADNAVDAFEEAASYGSSNVFETETTENEV